MAPIVFEMPEVIPPKRKADGSIRNGPAANTVKVYKSKLNFLAKNGFKNVNDLMSHAPEVCKLIKDKHSGNSDLDKQLRRIFLSAIFYVLPETYTASTNPFHQLFQNSTTPIPVEE